MSETNEFCPPNPTKPDPKASRAAETWHRIAMYAILLLAAAIYLPSIDGLALWDDRGLIGAYRSFSQCINTPFLQHYFRPVVSLTFFLEWRVWGRDAFYCHQDNILIHVATTAALIGLLRSLFTNRWIAPLGGLLFAVQPAQVSTVAWIGGRTDSLCTLWLTLFLLTLVLSIRAHGSKAWIFAAISVVCFELALLLLGSLKLGARADGQVQFASAIDGPNQRIEHRHHAIIIMYGKRLELVIVAARTA